MALPINVSTLSSLDVLLSRIGLYPLFAAAAHIYKIAFRYWTSPVSPSYTGFSIHDQARLRRSNLQQPCLKVPTYDSFAGPHFLASDCSKTKSNSPRSPWTALSPSRLICALNPSNLFSTSSTDRFGPT